MKVVRELVGTMDAVEATPGLLVCWAGFTSKAAQEARHQRFKIRPWDQRDLVQAIYRGYDDLSPEIQAELPLKRVWTLVQENATEGD